MTNYWVKYYDLSIVLHLVRCYTWIEEQETRKGGKKEEEWLYDTMLEFRENLKKRETESIVL